MEKGQDGKVQPKVGPDEEEDLFGEDEDNVPLEDSVALKKRKRHVDEDEDEDLFGQGDEADKKQARLLTSINQTDLPRDPNEKDPEKDEAHELNAITSEAAVASPVPRKVLPPSTEIVTSVPRKNSVSSPVHKGNESLNEKSPQSLASRFKLSESVVFPETLDMALVEGRILETLRQLPPNLCNDALQEYDDAVKQQKNIRSHGAYLFGVLKRYLSVHERAGGEGSMGHELTPRVQDRLNQLVLDQFCTQDEMNEKVKGKIRMLSEKDALFAIEEFASVDRGQIRNVGSYFMGILNRYMRGERVKDRQFPETERRRDRGRGEDSPHMGRHAKETHFGIDRQNSIHGRERPRDARGPYRKLNDRPDFVHQTSHYGHQMQEPPTHLSHTGQQRSTPPYHSFVPDQRYQQASGSSFVPQQNQRASIPPPPNRSPYDQQHIQQSPKIAYLPNQEYQQGHASSIVQHQIQNPTQYQQPPSMGQQVNQQSLGFQSHVQVPGMMSGAINHGYGAPPTFQAVPQNIPMTNVPSWKPQQGTPQPDILGIAAKAAQALAASRSVVQNQSSGYQVNQPPPTERYPGQPQGQPQSQPFHPGFQPQQNTPQNRRGKTTAMMYELPISVQFVVQNLQTVGYINGPLDEGILGMIKDLPEPMALEAINRFGSLDKSCMRNPTAYLAGMLRRELEKINRR